MTDKQKAEILACVRYLNKLEAEIMRRDLDMMIGDIEAPGEWAERLRLLLHE